MSPSTPLTFSPEQFLRQWFAMFPVADPRFEYDAFTSALVHLVADEQWAKTTSERLDVAGDFLLELDHTSLVRLFQVLAASPDFRAAALKIAWAFDRESGLDSTRPDVITVRQDAVRQFADSLIEPFEEHLLRRQESRERAERRRARREPLVDDLLPASVGDAEDDEREFSLTPVAPEADPSVQAAARECAQRVLARVRERLRPKTLVALSRSFTDPRVGAACDAARGCGLSPATLTRAMQALVALAREEVADLPEAGIPAFREHLITGLAKVA